MVASENVVVAISSNMLHVEIEQGSPVAMVSAEQELRSIADVQALEPGRTVDVAVLNRADPLLLKQVTDHAQLEYGRRRSGKNEV